MNNKYINSFIFLLLIISLVVINFNQEDELNVIEVGNETLEDVIKSTSSTSTSSTSTSSTSTSSTSSTTIFAGPYSEYAGFEGSNQAALDELSTQLPKLMLQIIETNNIKIINGCHQYGASLNNRCPYGVWDSSGTSPDGTKDADWSLSIWISNRAFAAIGCAFCWGAAVAFVRCCASLACLACDVRLNLWLWHPCGPIAFTATTMCPCLQSDFHARDSG